MDAMDYGPDYGPEDSTNTYDFGENDRALKFIIASGRTSFADSHLSESTVGRPDVGPP